MTWTSPRTWVADEVVTAAIMNTHVRDNLKVIGDAWTAYTPSLLNWTLGNGTLTGVYKQAGKHVRGTIQYTVGSTDTPSGTLVLTLPVASRISFTGHCVGTGMAWDNSAAALEYRTATIAASNPDRINLRGSGGSLVTSTVSWTWATSDRINVEFDYEAA